MPNYPMNLIEVRKLPQKVRERLTDKAHKIKHPEEFLDALSEAASDVQYKDVKKILTEEQKITRGEKTV